MIYDYISETFGNLKKSNFTNIRRIHIYTNKVMLLDKVLRDLIPSVCPLIESA